MHNEEKIGQSYEELYKVRERGEGGGNRTEPYACSFPQYAAQLMCFRLIPCVPGCRGSVHTQAGAESVREALHRSLASFPLTQCCGKVFLTPRVVLPECEEHIKRQIAGLVAQTSGDPVLFLEVVEQCWLTHAKQVRACDEHSVLMETAYRAGECDRSERIDS